MIVEPALDDVALAGVRHECAGGAAVVDALVLVEPTVLDGDDRLLQPRRHLVEPDGPVLDVRGDGRDHASVASTDDGALPELAREQRLRIARDEEERAAGRHERRQHARDEQQHRQCAEQPRPAPGTGEPLRLRTHTSTTAACCGRLRESPERGSKFGPTAVSSFVDGGTRPPHTGRRAALERPLGRFRLEAHAALVRRLPPRQRRAARRSRDASRAARARPTRAGGRARG